MTQSIENVSLLTRKTGKGAAGLHRKDRMVPGVIYGPKMENKNCLVEEIFILKHSGSKHESSIFNTQSEESDLNSLKVMLKNIDTHPRTNRPIHVDFYALDMSAKIKVNVPLELEGTAVGVKEEGGLLQVVLRDIEIECSPTDIPESIKVDISGVKLNGSLHVSEVTFPAGVTAITSAERTICTVAAPKQEAEAAPAEGEAAAEAAPAAE